MNENIGSSLSQGIYNLKTIGLCSEELWTYDINKFEEKPPDICYEEAKKHKILEYSQISQNENDIKSALASGNIIAIGIKIFKSFYDPVVATTGYVKLPKSNEDPINGHAIVIFGYDDNTRHFMLRNDWGSKWGDNGNFYLPYDYVCDENMANDMWIITKVT